MRHLVRAISFAFAFAIAAPFACSGAPKAPPTTVGSPPLASATNAASSEPEVAPPASSASSVSSVSSTMSDTNGDPCRGAAFDLDALPTGCKPSKLAGGPLSFDVRLVLDAPIVHGGDVIGVTVVMVNTSTADAVLHFTPSCARFDLEAWRDGKRADYVNDACGFGGGCGGKGVDLVVVPQGKVTKRLSLKAVVVVVQKTTCEDLVTGPLPPGVYELRVSNQLGSFPLQDRVVEARASVTVKK